LPVSPPLLDGDTRLQQRGAPVKADFPRPHGGLYKSLAVLTRLPATIS